MSGWTRQQIEEIVRTNKSFRGMKLHGADFSGLNLDRADFRSVSAPYAKFNGCSMKAVNAEGANFTCADFTGANVHRMNLKDAIMCDAIFDVTDAFGVTLTMDCRSFKGMKPAPGWWWGFVFYSLLMTPPDEDAKEKIQIAMGPERFKTLHDLYANRRM